MTHLLSRPPDAWSLFVLAHGAGAGMRHRFLERIARALADRGVATLRFQFPYMESGGRRPDPPAVLEAAVRSAVTEARRLAPDLPILAGGKSLGGRMTSSAMAREPIEGVRGLVFLGFPLHPPGKPGVGRAEHLQRVPVPMLFLQGTRDSLAELGLITSVCDGLGAGTTLHVVEGADHSFAVLKRSGRGEAEVLDELADTAAAWARRL
jgi:predicted alpha/beta-hydrolase family hydrolase